MPTKKQLEEQNRILERNIEKYKSTILRFKNYINDINLFVDTSLIAIEEQIVEEESWIVEILKNSSPDYIVQNVTLQFIRRHREAKEKLQEATKRLKDQRINNFC